ncbi:unnamed protein product [Ambrosiozyma monospora]|uniref:Unnamed protein product n=1 Tax=Ambrosiozyma monospora TaxID=43982 RepID=A0ACB5SZ44_AMBMO|nr:unnamed protein product [Ambrosiozyma monospora]
MPYHGSILFLNETTNGSLLIFLHPPLDRNNQMIEDITSFGGLVTRTLNNNAIIITSPERLDDVIDTYDHKRKLYDAKFVEDTINQERPLHIQDYVLFDPSLSTKTSGFRRHHSKEPTITSKSKRFTAEEDFNFAKTIFANCKSISVDQRGYESFYIPGTFYTNYAKMNGRTPESWRQRFKKYLLVFGLMNYLEYHILMIQNKKKPLPVSLANPKWLKARIAAAKVDVCLHYPGLPGNYSLLGQITFAEPLPKTATVNTKGNHLKRRSAHEHNSDKAKIRKTNGITTQKPHTIFSDFESDNDFSGPEIADRCTPENEQEQQNNGDSDLSHLFPKLRTPRKNLREPDFIAGESSDKSTLLQNFDSDDDDSFSLESSPFMEL